MTSFGKPLSQGKFYYGRPEDTPLNHDVLWRAQIRAENRLIAQQEAAVQRSGQPWTLEQAEALKEVIYKHYVAGAYPDFRELINDHKLQQKIGQRTLPDLEQEWANLEGTIQFDGPPPGLPPALRSLASELKMRETSKALEKRVGALDKTIRSERSKRINAERQAVVESRKTEEVAERLRKAKAMVAAAERRRKEKRQGH